MINQNEIIQGSALERLKELESESIDCCITSPPYWALRDYKTEGQIGLEPTFTEYITKLIQIFNEVKRVLKRTGSCWINMGDTYSQLSIRHRNGQGERPEDTNFITNERMKQPNIIINNRVKQSLPEKSLCLIPQRFQIQMVDAGWICRNTIIWYKPNCMPSSAKDRFTVDFEYLFFFTKSQRYYFDTQYEPLDSLGSGWDKQRQQGIDTNQYKTDYNLWGKPNPFKHNKVAPFGGNKAEGYENRVYSGNEYTPNGLGRIKRCVWKIPTQPFSDAHFAVFPPELVLTPLKSTCPEYVCKKCGRAREKIVEKEYDVEIPKEDIQHWKADESNNFNNRRLGKARITGENILGYNQCNCNAGFDGGLVLDPFIGSGTVGLVALQNARNFIGIELNPEYIKMAYERLDPYLKQQRMTEFADA